MPKHHKILSLILVFCILCSVSCQRINKYEYRPASAKEIEAILQSNEIIYEIEQNELTDGKQIFAVRDQNETFVSFQCVGENEEKAILLNLLFTKDVVSPNASSIIESSLNTYMKIADTIYGSDDFSQIHNDLLEKIALEEGKPSYELKRVGKNHFQLSSGFDSSGKIVNSYSYRILNEAAYEKYVSGQAKVLEAMLISKEIPLENCSILEMELRDENNKCFRIAGNIQNLKGSDNTIKIETDLIPSDVRFMTGMLRDKTGSIQVLINPTTFTSEELMKEKQHYVYTLKNEDNTYYIVLISD